MKKNTNRKASDHQAEHQEKPRQATAAAADDDMSGWSKVGSSQTRARSGSDKTSTSTAAAAAAASTGQHGGSGHRGAHHGGGGHHHRGGGGGGGGTGGGRRHHHHGQQGTAQPQQAQQAQQQQQQEKQQVNMSRQEATWQHMKDFWFHNKDAPVLRERFARRVRFAAEWLLFILEQQAHPDRDNLLEQLIDWCSIVIDADQSAELLEVSTEQAVRSLRGRVFGALKTLCTDFEHYTDAKRMQVSRANPNKLERSYVRTYMHENMLLGLLADRAELLRLATSGDKKDQYKPMEERNAELKRLVLAFLYEIHLRDMCDGLEGAAALAAWDKPEQRRIDAHLLLADVIGLVRNTVAQLSDSALKEVDDSTESDRTRAIREALGLHGPSGVEQHWSRVFLDVEDLQNLPAEIDLPGHSYETLSELFEQENAAKAHFQAENAREGAIVCLQLFGKDEAPASFDWTLKERYEHLTGGSAPDVNLRYPNLRESFVNALADVCPEPLPVDVHGPAERKFRYHVLSYFQGVLHQASAGGVGKAAAASESSADAAAAGDDVRERNEEELLTSIARHRPDVYLSEHYDYQVKRKLKTVGLQAVAAASSGHGSTMGHKARQQQQAELQAAAESVLTDDFLKLYIRKTKKNTHGYLIEDESSTAWSLMYFFMFAKELLRLRTHHHGSGVSSFAASSEHDHPWLYKERAVALLLRLFPDLLHIFDAPEMSIVVHSPFFARRQTFTNREEMLQLLAQEYATDTADE